MNVQYAPRICVDEDRRQDAHKSCKYDKGHAVCLQFFEQSPLEIRTLRIVPIDDGHGGDALFTCAFECIGIRLVRDDDSDLRRNIAALDRLDDGSEIRASPRAENAQHLLTHRRHRP